MTATHCIGSQWWRREGSPLWYVIVIVNIVICNYVARVVVFVIRVKSLVGLDVGKCHIHAYNRHHRRRFATIYWIGWGCWSISAQANTHIHTHTQPSQSEFSLYFNKFRLEQLEASQPAYWHIYVLRHDEVIIKLCVLRSSYIRAFRSIPFLRHFLLKTEWRTLRMFSM